MLVNFHVTSLVRSYLPDSRPASLCDNFRAGNLKNIKMYIEPSKKQDVTPRASKRLSS